MQNLQKSALVQCSSTTAPAGGANTLLVLYHVWRENPLFYRRAANEINCSTNVQFLSEEFSFLFESLFGKKKKVWVLKLYFINILRMSFFFAICKYLLSSVINAQKEPNYVYEQVWVHISFSSSNSFWRNVLFRCLQCRCSIHDYCFSLGTNSKQK
ncbi:hypothetical protein NL108_018104 [Boleophthalmus pectinirostris]|nr:hypothetical protein NL108_018104 [Boleophthalmus pectinirostris]